MAEHIMVERATESEQHSFNTSLLHLPAMRAWKNSLIQLHCLHMHDSDKYVIPFMQLLKN